MLVGKFYQDSFALHIAETLGQMGHVVHTYEPGLTFAKKNSQLGHYWRKAKAVLFDTYSRLPHYHRRQTSRFLKQSLHFRPDLILATHDFLTPEQVALVKQHTGAKVAMWYPDHIGQFHRAMFLAAPYDALFFKDSYIVRFLRNELGIGTAHYLPECCNPRYHRPVALSLTEQQFYGCDLTTAGNLHTNRAAFFSPFTEYECKIWGNPPPFWLDMTQIKPMLQNKYVANEEKAKAFRAAKIVLNNLQPGEIEGTNVRTFEVAGAGGFQLVNWRPALADLFVLGTEIDTFQGIPDLKEKIHYYLARPQERHQIAEAGSVRALRDHTYAKRLEQLISTLFAG